MFTNIAIFVSALTLISIVTHRKLIRIASVLSLLLTYLFIVVFGYTAARRHAVVSFDEKGQEISRVMSEAMAIYDSELTDIRIGISIIFLALIILAIGIRKKS